MVLVEHRHNRKISVRIDIARAQMLEHQILEWPLRAKRREVYHYGNVGEFSRFDAAIDGNPFRAGVMGYLDADNQVAITLGDFSGSLRIHIAGILFHVFTAAHAAADNVEHGENASLHFIDDLVAKHSKITPARTSGIDNRKRTRL